MFEKIKFENIEYTIEDSNAILTYPEIYLIEISEKVSKLNDSVKGSFFEMKRNLQLNWEKKNKYFKHLFNEFIDLLNNLDLIRKQITNCYNGKNSQISQRKDFEKLELILLSLLNLRDIFTEKTALDSDKKVLGDLFSNKSFEGFITAFESRFGNLLKDFSKELSSKVQSFTEISCKNKIIEMLKDNRTINKVLSIHDLDTIISRTFNTTNSFKIRESFKLNNRNILSESILSDVNFHLFVIKESNEFGYADYYIPFDISINLIDIIEKYNLFGYIYTIINNQDLEIFKESDHQIYRHVIAGQIQSSDFFLRQPNNSIRDHNKILVVDLETTGLDTKNDLIVEISIVELDINTGKQKILVDSFVKESRFDDSLSESYIFKNSDIKVSDIMNAIDFDVFYPALQTLFNKYSITSFNTSFDISILLNKKFRIPFREDCIMQSAKSICKIPHSYYGIKLPSLAEAYKIIVKKDDFQETHRSLYDAQKGAEILFEIIKVKNKKE